MLLDRERLAAGEPFLHAARHHFSNSLRRRSLWRKRPWRFFEKVEWSGKLQAQ
jgi:hypothetical protein